MHKEILSPEQLTLLSLLREFKKDFYLVGWTAIALHLGHRKSIDYDLFSPHPISHTRILAILIKKWYKVSRTLIKNEDELTIIVDSVKLTFLYFPFPVKWTLTILDSIKSLSLLEIAALKAYAMGRRAKWKDYVDMYFLIKDHFSIDEIAKKTDEIFAWAFNEKIFRQKLSYYEDIDYSEEVQYLIEPIPQDEICKYLTQVATKI